MNIERRISDLEQAAYRQGFDELSRRMAERLRTKSEAEIKAISGALEAYLHHGRVVPGLVETIKELTE
jgi:hypothetical protein